MTTELMADARPKISVIIPNYNHAKYLPQRIDSVLNQTYKNLEILILDDCSPDNSREIIERYAQQDTRIRTLFNTENSGSTFKQWHKGITHTDGKYLWIAESDDYADSRFLEELANKLEADDTIGLAYSESWHVYEDKGTVELNTEYYAYMDPTLWIHDFVLDGRTLITQFMSYVNIIPNASAVLLRRKTVEAVPLPDGQWKLVGDWLYWASIMAVSKVAFVATPLNYFRFHGNNVRSSKITNGHALLETVSLLKPLQQYGAPDTRLYIKKINECLAFWIHCMVSPDYKIPLSRHQEIYKAFSELEPAFGKRLSKELFNFLFKKNFSGLRQLVGDGMIYPLLKKIKQQYLQIKIYKY